MQPLSFTVSVPSSLPTGELFDSILNLDNWTSFAGFGPLPGIQDATFENPDSPPRGRRIRVTNKDGSRHVEQILLWNPPHEIEMELTEFSPPLSRLAERFVERWEFSDSGMIRRSFTLYSRNFLSLPVLWAVARLLRAAIARHTRIVAEGE